MMSGRLEHLSVKGTCLSYRFCTALYNCLRVKNGNSLVELVLKGCGLGNFLDVDPVELPALIANTYVKSMSMLPDGIVEATAVDLDLREDLEASGDAEDADAIAAALPPTPPADQRR